jgi:hypothetical protein
MEKMNISQSSSISGKNAILRNQMSKNLNVGTFNKSFEPSDEQQNQNNLQANQLANVLKQGKIGGSSSLTRQQNSQSRTKANIALATAGSQNRNSVRGERSANRVTDRQSNNESRKKSSDSKREANTFQVSNLNSSFSSQIKNQ